MYVEFSKLHKQKTISKLSMESRWFHYEQDPDVGIVSCNPALENRQIVATSSKDKILIWDLSQEREVCVSQSLSDITSLSWNLMGSLLAASSSDAHISLLDLRCESAGGPCLRAKSAISKVSCSQVDQYLFATGSREGEISFWDIRKVVHGIMEGSDSFT